MRKEDHTKIVNINSRHHNILSFTSTNKSRSRELSKDLTDKHNFAQQVENATRYQAVNYEEPVSELVHEP